MKQRPGRGWKHLAGSVWEHVSGIRIHLFGLAGLPGERPIAWTWDEQNAALKLTGFNRRRAVMVWAINRFQRR